MNLSAILGLCMFLTAGALVMALVLMLKANTLYAQCMDILSFVIDVLKHEDSDSNEQSEN